MRISLRFGRQWHRASEAAAFDNTVKRKVIFGALGCCVIAFIIGAGTSYNDAKTMARYDRTMHDATTVGEFVQQYRDEYGKYPSSLPELASKVSPNFQKLVNQVLADWSEPV